MLERMGVFLLTAFFLCLVAQDSSAAKVPTVILVDKKTNTLQVARYTSSEYEVVKTYHTTMGKVVGDKVDEGDLKTPEGIYRFTARLTPPTLKKKFGVMAFYMDYPNPYDRLAGRTGFDIMLHATDQPERLKKDFDSKGCIVVKDEELEEIQDHIELSLTPILVFDDLKDQYREPAGDDSLKQFFEKWVQSWEGKNIDRYIEAYHSAFRANGKNRHQWKNYKQALNRRYSTISVNPQNIQYYRHPKYAVISFTQNYRSTYKSRVAHSSRGTKMLYVAQEDGEFKIIDESFTPRMW